MPWLASQSVEHRLCTFSTFDDVPLDSSILLSASHPQLYKPTFLTISLSIFIKEMSLKKLSVKYHKHMQTPTLNTLKIHYIS